ncbi:MAG: ATP-binding protein [Erysipelotrichaceae bacterium]|nr:ATP-binding protein [Erysipelotrichaceae bacterium]MBQ1483496.1 ATP-binding protein [Erysipelotrichaceae bacterium]
MNKVVLICGRPGAGKTYYARKLLSKEKAVLLSNDELLNALFPKKHPNDDHGLMMRINDYLLRETVEIIHSGSDVILDWGFWKKEERKEISEYFMKHGVYCEWHYIDVNEEQWKRNIAKRNEGNNGSDFILPEDVLVRADREFEEPDPDEIDVWFENRQVT